MKLENRKRDKVQGVRLKAENIKTSELGDGEDSEMWRYFT
jgi:hypothetical protein